MVHLIINNRVYDVDRFMKSHPGGADILKSHDNMDVTDVFLEFHRKNARRILASLPYIDTTPPSSNAFHKDILKLRDTLLQEGQFTPRMNYYAWKLVELLGLFLFCSYILKSGYLHPAACIMGLFFQQSGWLSHDIAHNQLQVINKYRAVLLTVVGNIFQGFSGAWWIRKHMLHHAHVNGLHEISGEPMEEDFDTAPLLVWTERLLNNSIPYIIHFQGYYLWLILPFSKLYWDFQSIRVAIRNYIQVKDTEIYYILLHYALVLTHAYYMSVSPLKFVILSRCWGGFFLAWVFIQSHNGMTYYTRKTLGFYEAQILATRNMGLGPISTWFTGGLNYQIEHHLFPQMPRHNLKSISTHVKQICAKHCYPYISLDILRGSIYLTRHLQNVATCSK